MLVRLATICLLLKYLASQRQFGTIMRQRMFAYKEARVTRSHWKDGMTGRYNGTLK
jgi:hypothetical protein